MSAETLLRRSRATCSLARHRNRRQCRRRNRRRDRHRHRLSRQRLSRQLSPRLCQRRIQREHLHRPRRHGRPLHRWSDARPRAQASSTTLGPRASIRPLVRCRRIASSPWALCGGAASCTFSAQLHYECTCIWQISEVDMFLLLFSESYVRRFRQPSDAGRSWDGLVHRRSAASSRGKSSSARIWYAQHQCGRRLQTMANLTTLKGT